VVLSAASALAPPALAPALAAPQAVHQVTSMLPLSITGVSIQNGQLTAQGLLGSTPFSAPLTLSTPAATTPILDLHINAIHLNVLGLKVDTSDICLSITAPSGLSNTLGGLLSDVTNLLNGGTPLGTILGGFNAQQIGTLTDGLTSLLNGVFGRLTSPAAVTGASTNILHLSLGPVDLNLLGLDVHLDNCANGPITVDITAQSGPGQLLGNLLSGLSHLLDSQAASTAILHKLSKIADAILAIL